MVKELELIPPFKEGEILIVQRTVDGKNVFMFATLTGDAFDHLSQDEICFTGRLDTWGSSSHADGQIARQVESINRLLSHLQAHCLDDSCPHR